MKKYLGVIAAAMVGLGSAPGLAQVTVIECNSTYTTQRGDSLSRIAEGAYGNPREFQRIFDLNPGVLTSPNVVPIGIDLYIPCADGTPPMDAGGLPVLQPADSDALKILTGDHYAPYVGSTLPRGGFSRALVEYALQAEEGEPDYRIDTIADWGSHLRPLIADGAYALGFPWYKPACTVTYRDADSNFRCDALLFSDPLHQVVVTFYGRAGEVDHIRAAQDAAGLQLCRPSGFFTHDLEELGLTELMDARLTPNAAQDCMRMLISGEADLISANADTLDAIAREMGVSNEIQEVVDFSSVQTLHVVGLRANPDTRLHLRRINQGLRNLMDAGYLQMLAPEYL